MKRVKTATEVREIVSRIRGGGERIGFVPTMGALHEGHMSLINLARSRTDFVVTSIFVNPKQFGPKEDYSRYPRDFERDGALMQEGGCDLLFLPSATDMYSPGDRTRVHVEGVTEFLCGASRPGHFNGVALIVAKLFNIVLPDEAYFGQKDAQQAVVIQRMAADLDFPVRIVIGPTVREADGLAMSSRNAYLSTGERSKALALHAALTDAQRAIEEGERDAAVIRSAMNRIMAGAGIEVEYAEVVDAKTMRPRERIDGTVLLAVAGRLGGARLIDNVALMVDGDGVGEIVLEFPEWSRYAWRR